MTIIATNVEGKHKATFDIDGELPADPGIDADSIELVQTDHLLKVNSCRLKQRRSSSA